VIPLATAHGWSGLSSKERLYYFFDRRLLARYPVVITVSEVIRRTLIDHGAPPGRVRRILNGIDHRCYTRSAGTRRRLRAALGIPPESVVVGAVGRLERVKRFDVLLEAMAGLHLSAPSLLLLIGEGSCRSDLEAQARSLGIHDRVRFLGYRDDAGDLHQVLDIYAQSSDSEGIPNAVLEAMAMETPVVATDVGGTREIIEPRVHGLLVDARDAAGLRSAIRETCTDADATAARVRAARTRIERELSFDARNAALEDVYVELMQERRRGTIAAGGVS
jgi:glycosyltransferase involved in cell wall biosynthesis